ncbi:hypothetical protein AWV79_17380 [Cupriavidus sp. UYMMa02A]|nr:hypothetical protein AWV79_17380 [Cupriavidus sp. UYMMa02A]
MSQLPNAAHGFEHGIPLTRQARVGITATMAMLHGHQFVDQQSVQLFWFKVVDVLCVAKQ